MPLLNWLSLPKRYQRFKSDEALFEGLRTLDNAAIVYLQTRALPSIKKIVRQSGLPPEHSEDILNQSTLIFLRKIETVIRKDEAGSYNMNYIDLIAVLVKSIQEQQVQIEQRQQEIEAIKAQLGRK